MSEQIYYRFGNRDEELPPILDFTAKHPDLVRVVVQAAQEKIDKPNLRRTSADAEAMTNLQSFFTGHNINYVNHITLGMAILQLEKEGLVTLPPS